MSAAQSLLHSYSFASRKRSKQTARTEAKHAPAGLAFAKRQALPLRRQVVLLRPKFERVNGRVLARCLSISSAGSILLSSSFTIHRQPSVLRAALEGVLRSFGSTTSKYAADATAGLVKDVLGETVEHLHKCASEEVVHKGGSAVLEWLSKIDKSLLARLAAYSAMVDTPVHQYWEDFLDAVVIPADPNSPLAVAIKVLLDQGLMAPMAMALMLVVFKVLEGRPSQALPELQQRLVERLVPEWAVWPMARVIEFTLVPQESRALFEGMVGIANCAFGLFKLRQKIKARMPTSVQDATSQALSRSLEVCEPSPPALNPRVSNSAPPASQHHDLWPGIHVRRAKPSRLSHASSSRSDPIPSPTGHWYTPFGSAANQQNGASASSGFAAAAAALSCAGILDRSTSIRVRGLAPVQETHMVTPFSALAHEPLHGSGDADAAGWARAGSVSPRLGEEQWRAQGRMNRLAVVSGSS